MLAPRSYPREDVIELQCLGSDVCLGRVLRACLEAGARLAEPGEFTLRAFLNGRLDLSQSEIVERLISAKSVAAADSALTGIHACMYFLRLVLLASSKANLSICQRGNISGSCHLRAMPNTRNKIIATTVSNSIKLMSSSLTHKIIRFLMHLKTEKTPWHVLVQYRSYSKNGC